MFEMQTVMMKEINAQLSQLCLSYERQFERQQDFDEQWEQFQAQTQQFFEQPSQPREIIATDSICSSVASGNDLTIEPREYDGGPDKNLVVWLVMLEEAMEDQYPSDGGKIRLVASLLSGAAAQWFVNLKSNQQRPSSWTELKDKMLAEFQPADFQENLRYKLLQLQQKRSISEYIHSFEKIVSQIQGLDELTQVTFFVNGLSPNVSLHVRSKHPQSLADAIREVTAYGNVSNVYKNFNYTCVYEPASRCNHRRFRNNERWLLHTTRSTNENVCQPELGVGKLITRYWQSLSLMWTSIVQRSK